ncbi:MAG: glycogen synthase, partial [Acidimicrobiaceae bacterium]
MTKILVLTLYYPPHHYGGYEVSCRDVMERLAARGHDITVLTSDLRRSGVDDPPGERAAGVRRDLRVYFRDHDVWAPSVPGRWLIERHNQRVLRQTLDDVRPDVVAVWHFGAASLGLLTTLIEQQMPLVYAMSDDWLCYGPELDAWSRLWVDHPKLGNAARALLRVPTVLRDDLGEQGAFCFISEVTRQRAEQYSRWTYPDATIVYSGIDGTLFPRRSDAGERPWQGRLLYVGRYDPRKGIETAIRALVHLDAATLEVQGTGDPDYRDRLVVLADELGVAGRVTFGAVERDELAERYAAADAVVFPSEWEEPFGLVPVEAMAVGTPVIATGVGGSGEFLFDAANCVRFTAGDDASLAAAVERLAVDPDLRRRIVAGGVSTAEYFD